MSYPSSIPVKRERSPSFEILPRAGPSNAGPRGARQDSTPPRSPDPFDGPPSPDPQHPQDPYIPPPSPTWLEFPTGILVHLPRAECPAPLPSCTVRIGKRLEMSRGFSYVGQYVEQLVAGGVWSIMDGEKAVCVTASTNSLQDEFEYGVQNYNDMQEHGLEGLSYLAYSPGNLTSLEIGAQQQRPIMLAGRVLTVGDGFDPQIDILLTTLHTPLTPLLLSALRPETIALLTRAIWNLLLALDSHGMLPMQVSFEDFVVDEAWTGDEKNLTGDAGVYLVGGRGEGGYDDDRTIYNQLYSSSFLPPPVFFAAVAHTLESVQIPPARNNAGEGVGAAGDDLGDVWTEETLERVKRKLERCLEDGMSLQMAGFSLGLSLLDVLYHRKNIEPNAQGSTSRDFIGADNVHRIRRCIGEGKGPVEIITIVDEVWGRYKSVFYTRPYKSYIQHQNPEFEELLKILLQRPDGQTIPENFFDWLEHPDGVADIPEELHKLVVATKRKRNRSRIRPPPPPTDRINPRRGVPVAPPAEPVPIPAPGPGQVIVQPHAHPPAAPAVLVLATAHMPTRIPPPGIYAPKGTVTAATLSAAGRALLGQRGEVVARPIANGNKRKMLYSWEQRIKSRITYLQNGNVRVRQGKGEPFLNEIYYRISRNDPSVRVKHLNVKQPGITHHVCGAVDCIFEPEYPGQRFATKQIRIMEAHLHKCPRVGHGLTDITTTPPADRFVTGAVWKKNVG